MNGAPAWPREGRVDWGRGSTWWCEAGNPDDPRPPVVLLHGGPGVPHDYLDPLAALARTGRRVVAYDQLGCGRSRVDHPPQGGWVPGIFLEEVRALREGLGLEQIHLLGQSWGGMLALEYALTHPAGLRSLVLASTMASVADWSAASRELRRQMPTVVAATLDAHERGMPVEPVAYEEATLAYYEAYVCRVLPFPEPLRRSMSAFSVDPAVYLEMWGANEFSPTGALKDWDVRARLASIDVPVLVTSGRWDESTPAVSGVLAEGIPGARWRLFEESAHMAHLEEPETYLQVVEDFLDDVESVT